MSLDSKSSNKHKIAICQLTCTANKDENFLTCKKLITEAKNQGAEMVFLPEACDYIESSTKASLANCETLDGNFISNFRKLAADLDVWISIGSFHRKDESKKGSKLFNSHVVLDNKGEVKCVADKIHLFELNLFNNNKQTTLKESEYTTPGKIFNMPIKTPIGFLGPSICFDLRFPQLGTILRKLGAQILSYPSVFTEPTGKAHWEILLRARAIENQCYVIAAAQVGNHNEKRSSYGHSMVVDPWGKVIANCLEESPTFKIVEIDLDYLNEVRSSIPILNSFRNDLYLQIPLVKRDSEKEFYMFGENIKIIKQIIFVETQHCIAFVNIKPIVPGHVVLIPKNNKRIRVEDMSDEESADLFILARLVGSKLEKHFNATSINFGIQDGPDSGQSVSHVHLHVLPRRKGDFEKNDEIYERLKKHDKEEGGLRTEKEMIAEAAVLRKLFE